MYLSRVTRSFYQEVNFSTLRLVTLQCVPTGINPLDGVVIMASTNREDVLDQVSMLIHV